MNLFYLGWKNLVNKPLNLTLNLLLFALGIGLIVFILLINQQMNDKFEKNLAGIDLVIGAKGSPLQLILCSMYHVDAPTGNISLKEAKPFLNPKHPYIETAIPLSLGDNYKGYRIVGTNEKILDLYEASIGEGKSWGQDFEVIVGSGVAKDLNLNLGKTFHSAHGLVNDDLMSHDHHDFKVVGILNQSGSVIDQLILCSTETIWAVHGKEEDIPEEIEEDDQEITSLLLLFKGQNFQTLTMARNININTNMLAASPAIQMNQLYANIGVGEKALRWLAMLIVFVSALSLFISLYASLKDRRYELAIMRVMGASVSKIFGLIIVEGIMIAALGCILGLTISHVGVELLSGPLKEAYRYNFTGWIILPEEYFIIGGALIIGFVAAFIPALQARRTEISKTLTEG